MNDKVRMDSSSEIEVKVRLYPRSLPDFLVVVKLLWYKRFPTTSPYTPSLTPVV